MASRHDLGETSETRKHSINLARGVSDRLRRLAFENTISEAAVVEYALRQLFLERDDRKLARVLREAGARGRRTITG